MQRAGDRAHKAAAIQEAVDHYRAALARIDAEDEPTRANLLRSLGECQWLMSDLQDAVHTFTEARDLFERLGDERAANLAQRLEAPEVVMHAMGSMCEAHFRMGNSALGREAEAQRATDQLLQWMTNDPGYESRCTLPLINACRWRAGRGDVAGARECLACLQAGMDRGETRDVVVAVAEARGYVALAESGPGPAADFIRSALNGWRELGRPFDAMRTLVGLAQALLQCGDSDAAGTAVFQARRIAEELAGQLEEGDRDVFLESTLVREVHRLREGVESDAQKQKIGGGE